MFIKKKTLNTILVDLMVTKAKVEGLQLTIRVLHKHVREVLDNNQSIIDTNKLVLDKLEEIIKANSLE